jgi:hypothetical protein
MQIDKPIFIVGSGRSGTSILYELLSIHKHLCWFSTYSDRIPAFPYITILHRIFDIPIVGDRIKNSIITKKKYLKFLPHPSEGGNIYHNYCGFEHAKKTTEFDFNLQQEKKFKKIILKHLKMTGKSRFISKQTANNQRIRLINKMFPNAYYIHIIRDGRGVANSLYNIKWWNDVDIWWFGNRPSKWKEMGDRSILLCGLQWEKDVVEILKNKYLFEDRYIEIKYERLVEDTKNIIKKIAYFCELSWYDKFEKNIPSKLTNMNYKWREKLTNIQKKTLNKHLNATLNRLGY